MYAGALIVPCMLGMLAIDQNDVRCMPLVSGRMNHIMGKGGGT